MALVLKAILLQVFWYLTVAYGVQFGEAFFALSLILVFANYFLFKPEKPLGHYIFVLCFFLIYGLGESLLLSRLELYRFKDFPFFLISLYAVFLCYYGDILNYLSKKSPVLLSLIGGLGGVAAFFGGTKISGLEVLSPFYFLGIFISWGIFFPLSIYLFYDFSLTGQKKEEVL